MARLKVLFVDGPRDVVGLLLLGFTSSALLIVMLWLVNNHKTAALDRVGFDLLASTPGSTFARVGDHGRLIAPLFLVVLLVALVVTTVMRRGAWADAAGLVGGFVLCLVAARLLKAIELRPRPPRELIYAGGYSFPSTDSALAVGIAAMAVVAARLVSTRQRQIALIATGCGLTVFAGLLFVALRVHYASDVIAGWALGCAAFVCSALAALRSLTTQAPNVTVRDPAYPHVEHPDEPASEDGGLGDDCDWNVVNVCAEDIGAYPVRCLPTPTPHFDRGYSRPVES